MGFKWLVFMGRNSSYRKYSFFFHIENNRTIHTEETFIRYKKYDVAKSNKKEL